MRREYIFILMTGIMIGCQSGPFAPTWDALRYFPLATGNTWDYNWTYNNGVHDTTISWTVTLGNSFTFDGVRWYPTVAVCWGSEVFDATPLGCASYAHEENKTIAQAFGGIRYRAPQAILDFPLFVGKEWIIENKDTTYVDPSGDRIHDTRFSARHVLGVEAVTVPAGNMSCFHIEDRTRTFYHIDFVGGLTYSSSGEQHTDEWFAPYVGLVKQIVNSRYSDPTGEYNFQQLFELRSYSVRMGD